MPRFPGKEIGRNNLLAAKTTTAAKEATLQDLIRAMKSDIRYAKNTVNYDDQKLKLISWAGKNFGGALAPPGQIRLPEAPRQGNRAIRQ